MLWFGARGRNRHLQVTGKRDLKVKALENLGVIAVVQDGSPSFEHCWIVVLGADSHGFVYGDNVQGVTVG